MIHFAMRYAALVALWVLSSCHYTNEGSGSGTLEVTLTGHYRAGLPNRVVFNAQISRDHSPVTDAKVILTDENNHREFVLLNTCVENHSVCAGGTYQGEWQGYFRRLHLDITAPEGHLTAQLEGPSVHRITFPANENVLTLLDLKDGLNVKWLARDGLVADTVTVMVGQEIITRNEDEGKLRVKAAKNLKAGSHEVAVIRTNAVDLAGGQPGSSFSLSYEAHNSFTLKN